MLKAKEREMECLLNKLSEKDDLLKQYCCQIEELKKDNKNKCKKFQDVLKQLKGGNKICSSEDASEGPCGSEDLGELVNAILKYVEDQSKSVTYQLQDAECQVKTLAAEKKMYIKERNEITNKLECLISDKERLLKELASQKLEQKADSEKEELLETIDALKKEKNELSEKIKTLHENIQEINNNFKETRWALTSEVAEKHDQVQELKRCVGVLEEQLRQADMQTHFKDDIIKELRKELKATRKSLSSMKNATKIPPFENSSPAQLITLKAPNSSTVPKKGKDEDLKVDIHIFPLNENKDVKRDQIEDAFYLSSQSVEIQTDPCRIASITNMRNVSTQHKTPVQKLPRSFGTLTVTPWSGAAGELPNADGNLLDLQEAKKNLKGIYTDRPGLYDVVAELKERKDQCVANARCQKSEMSKHQCGITCAHPDKQDDKKNSNETEKLMSQIECLKKSLKAKAEELKCQEEFAKGLEQELAKSKMDLCALENFQRQERQSKSSSTMNSESDFARQRTTLICAINKIEEILRDLAENHSCEDSGCKPSLDKEAERIRSVKKDLERSKSKVQIIKSADTQCSLIHLNDVDKFREKAITGAVALEQMKEQIDILEGLIKKYIEEFPCECDKAEVGNCEDKLSKLRTEFDEATYQLCEMLQKLSNKLSSEDMCYSLNGDETINFKEDECTAEETFSLKSECQVIQKEVCDQENAAEKLKRISKQMEEEIQQKRCHLMEYTRELDSKIREIFKLRELIRKVRRRLMEVQCGPSQVMCQETPLSSGRSTTNLSGLFCDIQELWHVLEQSLPSLIDLPQKLREDNENLREKLACLEKCVRNKEETLRHLQDTVKLRECQIEELKDKMETSECQSTKLAQDVEEKCLLIANLQEAVRKCKQYEVNLELLESLRFEYCDLKCKLEQYEKEIRSKDRKMERLHNEITHLSSKNFLLTEKIKILDPKLRILYKTSHLFEKTVSDLQEQLCSKEDEIENLYGKVRELETELERGFQKCETRSADDAKLIEELSLTIEKFQNDLYCAEETEKRLKKEMEERETEFNNTVFQLRAEAQDLLNQSQHLNYDKNNSSEIMDLECMLKEAECKQKFYEKTIQELHQALDCIALEHEEERKGILQKLSEEKKENFKNKNLITKLNENIRQKLQTEKDFKECMDHLKEEVENLKLDNQELRTEVEARKKVMCAMEKEGGANLTELEEFICSLKIQKAELRSRCCCLKAEVEKEMQFKRQLECRIEDLNSMLQNKMQKFNEMAENYKCTSSRIQETCERMKEIEESLLCSQGSVRNDEAESGCLKKLLDVKTAENAKLVCQVQVLRVEIESIQSESAAVDMEKDTLISRLQGEVECLENGLEELQTKCEKLNDENQKLLKELECWTEKGATMQNEFRERQKDLCGKLRTTISEKNDLLNSMDELQRQLEQICLDNVNKEKLNRELSEKCSRLKVDKDSNDNYIRNKTDKIICNLSKEVKNLHHELCEAKESYNVLKEEYQAVLDQFKCCEKKKCNLEKLYIEANNENKELLESKANYERELCELQSQNQLLKDKIASKGDLSKNSDEKKKFFERIKELTLQIKTLEKKIIPELEQEIADKICCIENLKVELRDANLSSQRMRNEAMRVIEHTRKYLAAQRYANETLKSRLECSNKRGNLLGIENRELEEQLKAVTRMNEFLLCQLESGKNDTGEAEPRSFLPLPWGCSMVERDTSSSEYLAESGFQSMQPSPIIMEYDHEAQFDCKRTCSQWNSLKKNKCAEPVEFTPFRSGTR